MEEEEGGKLAKIGSKKEFDDLINSGG